MGYKFSRKVYKKLRLILFCFFSCLHAGHQFHFSVYNTPPKYDIHTKHFDYANPDAPKGGALKIGILGTFDGLNPFSIIGNSPSHIGLFCFAKLLDDSKDEIGVSYPYVAKSLKISKDKKKIIFYLREDASFSDGSPITAEDVLWSFNFLIKINPMMRQYYKNIIKVDIINQKTIVFYNNNPHNKELPQILGQIYVFHSKFFKKHANERGAITKPFPVSGPYKISIVDFGHSITLKRIKNWWGEKLPINRGLYNFDIIEGQFFKDSMIAFQAFLSGNTNFWVETSPKQWHTAYNIKAVKEGNILKKLIPNENSQYTKGMIFNLRRTKFQDIRVRKAISLLFNFESMNKSLFYNEYKRLNSYYGYAKLAHPKEISQAELKILEPYKNKIPEEIFSSSFKNPVYTDNLVPRETLQLALDLFKQAGWELKDQQLTNKNKEIFEIDFVYSNSAFEKVILHLQRNLQVVGIKLNPRLVDACTYTEMLDRFDFDMTNLIIPQSHSLGNEQREFFGSKSANIKGSKNLAGINNVIIDELVEKLIVAKDYQSMLDYTHAIDRVLCWNYYMILQYDFPYLRIAYWNKFGMPEKIPQYFPIPFLSWWMKDTEQQTQKNSSIFSGIYSILKGWFS